jgi:AraC family transcriptional regulator
MLSARQAVMDYVEAHLSEDCALFALAEAAKLSPYHFARAFHAETGDTPHQFVLRRRVSRAQQLLKHSGLALTQVALDCGFSSQQRMNDVFSRMLGISPGRYRHTVARSW